MIPRARLSYPWPTATPVRQTMVANIEGQAHPVPTVELHRIDPTT